MGRPTRAWPRLAAVALLAAGSHAQSLVLSADDKQSILAIMNSARADRGACPLEWYDGQAGEDTAIEKVGGGDPAKCPRFCFSCSGGEYVYFPYGADTDSAFQMISMEVNKWVNSQDGEAQVFKSQGPTEDSLHYQKVVNKKATKVACAACKGIEQQEWGPIFWNYLYCHYDVGAGSDVAPADIGELGDTCDKCATKTCPATTNQCEEEAKCIPSTGECVYGAKEDNSACDDNDPTTGISFCKDGKCVGYDLCAGVQCDNQLNQCEMSKCNPANGNCEKTPVEQLKVSGDDNPECDDGDDTTTNDQCECSLQDRNGEQWRVCTGVCRGQDVCETADCSPPECQVCATECCDSTSGTAQCMFENAAKDTVCDDGRQDTRDDKCNGNGECVGTSVCMAMDGSEIKCEPQRVGSASCQQEGQCDPTTALGAGVAQCKFTYKQVGAQCDDNSDATINDKCVPDPLHAGQTKCEGTSKCAGVVCDAPDQCHLTGVCQEETGECYYAPKEFSQGDQGPSSTKATQCDDGNPKTDGDVCTWVTLTDGTNEFICQGVDPCEGVVCPTAAAGSCFFDHVCVKGICEERPKASGTECDDGDDKTAGDVCGSGNVCLGVDNCAGKGPGGTRRTCSDPTDSSYTIPACLSGGKCNPIDGKCIFDDASFNKVAGTACDDGDAGTLNDKCVISNTGELAKCEGEAPCQIDLVADTNGVMSCPWQKWADAGLNADCNTVFCNSATNRCEVRPNKQSCDDGNPQTVADICVEASKDFQDPVTSTTMTLTVGECVELDLCQQHKGCEPLACHQPGVCEKSTGKCVYTPLQAGLACDDGSDKTQADQCTVAAGGKMLCLGTDLCAGVVCTAASACHTAGKCDFATGVCSTPFKPEGANCDDGNAQTVHDKCDGQGNCGGTNLCANGCPAPQPCYAAGTCDPQTGTCSTPFAAKDTACDDGNDKTQADKCDGSGQCVGTNLCQGVKCPPLSPCHKPGVCDYATGQCSTVFQPADTLCDDNDPLTKDGKCDANGVCISVPLCQGVSCSKAAGTAGQCYVDGSCDATTGKCKCDNQLEWSAGSGCPNVGAVCDDNSDKTVQDKCVFDKLTTTGFGCVGIDLCAGVACPPISDCHKEGVCNPTNGVCSTPVKVQGQTCDDGDDDTVEDKCDGNGVCKGIDLCAGVVCVADGPCREVGECNSQTGDCSKPKKTDGTECDDGAIETVKDKCVNGQCIGEAPCGGQTCTAKTQCYISSCEQPANVCTESPGIVSEKCDDGDDTTKDDKCEHDFFASPITAVCRGTSKCQGVTCPAASACHEEGQCISTTGQCNYNLYKPSGTACDDQDDNTVQDQCDGQGNCAGYDLCAGVVCPAPIVQCVQPKGWCNPATGNCLYAHAPVGSKCDDGDAETVDDTCDALQRCVGINKCAGKPACPEQMCRTGTCDPESGECKYELQPKDTHCDDGVAATVNDKCTKDGRCIGENKCENKPACPQKVCRKKAVCDYQTGECPEGDLLPAGTPCNDGDSKTVDDQCDSNGDCKGTNHCLDAQTGNPKECKSPLPCLVYRHCLPWNGQCLFALRPDGTPCDDGDPDTIGDVCGGGECRGEDLCAKNGNTEEKCGKQWAEAGECNALGKCDPKTGLCTNPLKDDFTACDDGNAGTVNDYCNKGQCVGSDPCAGAPCAAPSDCYDTPQCVANQQTNSYTCIPVKKPAGTSCDDGNGNTVLDKCGDSNGKWQCAGQLRCGGKCPASTDPCKKAKCVTTTNPAGECVDVNVDDDLKCDDGNPLTADDKCTNGVCAGEDRCAGKTCPLDTGLEPQCYDEGTCCPCYGICRPPTPKPDGTSCNDGEDQTFDDKCQKGKCVGTNLCKFGPKVDKDGKKCPKKNSCYSRGTCQPLTGLCDEGTPKQAGKKCNDKNGATVEDVCVADTNGGMKCEGRDPCAAFDCKLPNDQCYESVTCKVGPAPKYLPVCEAVEKPRGTACNDGNDKTVNDKCRRGGRCIGKDLCKNKRCKLPKGASKQCNTVGVCDYNTGKCSAHTVLEGTDCNDGKKRSVLDKCTKIVKKGKEIGVCRGTYLCKGVTCPGATQCRQAGKCDWKTGNCKEGALQPQGTACNDEDRKTKDDVCAGDSDTCKGTDICAGVVCPAPVDQCQLQGVCDPQIFKDSNGCYGSSNGNVLDHSTISASGQDCSNAFNSCPVPADGAPDTTPADPTGLCTYKAKKDFLDCDDGDDSTKQDVCMGGKCQGVSCSIEIVEGGEDCTFGSRGEQGGYGWTPDANLYVDGDCKGKFLLKATNAEIVCEAHGQYTECRWPMVGGPTAGSNKRDVWSVIKKQCVPTPELPGCKMDKCWIDHGAGCCGDDQGRAFSSYTKISMVARSECLKLAENYFDAVFGIEWNDKTNRCKLLVAPGTILVDPADGGWDETDSSGPGEAPVHQVQKNVQCPDVQCISQRDKCVGVKCTKKGECYQLGSCQDGKCTNPFEDQGTTCDPNLQTNDRAALTQQASAEGLCDGNGKCEVVDPPGCFVAWASKGASSGRVCRNDKTRCRDVWGKQVWGTMEECCRPGNAFKGGCAGPPPAVKDNCWRANTWFPERSCIHDPVACSWDTWEEGVFKSKEECCKKGNAFECGCSEPPKPKPCFVKDFNSYDTTGRWKRECVDHGKEDGSKCDAVQGTKYNSREECCKTEWGPYGCTLPCPSLDVVIVLDGSGSMAGRFSGHSHGYYATIEMIKRWFDRVPLTGEKAGQGRATLPNGGVRVGLVQFSGKYRRSEAKTTPRWPSKWGGKETTGGRLSGDLNQLQTDVAWHRKYFYRQGTYIKKGLELAGNMFEDSVPNRQRAVILLTDGRIYDEKELAAARRVLDQKRATVFGVVVRKQKYHTSTDTTAERILKPILSKPEDEHFYNVPIDEIPPKILDGMCDPNSPWGAHLSPAAAAAARQVPPEVAKSATGQGKIWDKNRRMKPFDDVSCDAIDTAAGADPQSKCGCNSQLEGTIVMIEEGRTNKDKLSCSKCHTLGISAQWRATSGILALSGKNKVLGDFVKAVKLVEFETSSTDTKDRKFTYNFGEAWGTSTSQGHYYQYFPKKYQWHEAQRACEGKLLLGMKGYLITVTSKEEQKLAEDKLAGQGWMGASDAGQEGQWKWVTGPEGCPGEVAGNCDNANGLGLTSWRQQKGTTKSGSHKSDGTFFFQQNGVGGTAQKCGTEDCYTNWAWREPNEYRKPCPGDCRCCGEDFAHFWWPRGTWNDYPLRHYHIQGYICEWGGIGKPCLDTPLESRTFVHTSMYKPPPPTPAPVDPCKDPITKPDPLPADGCLMGWELTPNGLEMGWKEEECKKKCLSPSGGKILTRCTEAAGSGQMCRCPREATAAQCRCKTWNDGASDNDEEYCASKAGDNGKQCFPTVEPEFTIKGKAGWDTDDTYFGEPPATMGDGDEQYKCQTYDRTTATWGAALFDGQCQDKDAGYFARYARAVDTATAQETCKAFCANPSYPECHSINWGAAVTEDEQKMCKARNDPNAPCSICTLNVYPPASMCAADQVLCKKPGVTPPPGDKCGCSKYIGGACKRAQVFCSQAMNSPDMRQCKLPNSAGECGDGWEKCGGGTGLQLPCKAGKCIDVDKILPLIAKPLNILYKFIVIHSVCPASVADKSKTVAQQKANGCAYRAYTCGGTERSIATACGEYRNGAKRGDAVVCRKNTMEQGIFKCMRPNGGDGKCPGDHSKCGMELKWPSNFPIEPVVVTFTIPKQFWFLYQTIMFKASKGLKGFVQLNAQTPARRAEAQQVEDDLIDAFDTTNQNIGQPVSLGADMTEDDVVDVVLDPNAIVKNNENASPAPAGPSTPGSNDEDDNSSMIGGIISAVLASLAVVGVLGFFAMNRKKKVSWTDAAVRRDDDAVNMTDIATAPAQPQAYLEMQKASPSLLAPSSGASPMGRKSPSQSQLGATAGSVPEEIAL